jgi:hypothetical protein
MTRAFLFLGHGDPVRAFLLNPGSVVVFLAVIALWVNTVQFLISKKEVQILLSRRCKTFVCSTAALLTAAVWLYNLFLNPYV